MVLLVNVRLVGDGGGVMVLSMPQKDTGLIDAWWCHCADCSLFCLVGLFKLLFNPII